MTSPLSLLRFRLLALVGLILLSVLSSLAHDRTAVEKLSVLGQREALPTRPGSAHLIPEAELQKFRDFDIHQALRSVPGVNIQEEEGFGLRPNIGLRGGNPHRSKKVAIMEDGVLIGPAPYSAPAAYYFPDLAKIAAIEVFKGTPSTEFGPNSIGGALNLVTKMNEPGVRLGATGGNFGFARYDVNAGVETYGDFSLSLSRIESTGFKELSVQENTGFIRQNATLRWDKYFVKWGQNINLKLNWADENSNETYTGLTDADFSANAYQRYAGTARDKMDWTHRQFFASYSLTPLENLRVRTTLYHHEFGRSWDKLNGFGDGVNASVDIREVLRNPNLAANNYFYRVLSGQANSGVQPNNRDVLEMGDNQRQYFSQGLQVNLDYELDQFAWNHMFSFSYRRHNDGINRYHVSSFYNMQNGEMVENANLNGTTTVLNTGRTQAQTFALNYETQWEDLTINAIGRMEDIEYQQSDLLTNGTQNSTDQFFAPGVGVYYQAFSQTGFLLGVNKGFTPTGPGQSPSIAPEEAINYELGMRHTGWLGAELIGFYSDYKNLLGNCTQSNGCDINQLDQSFNGGQAEVFGAELLLRRNFKLSRFEVPIMLTGTYTQAQFRGTFVSNLNEWGIGTVQAGDPIPYIPEWQGNLSVGLEGQKFAAYLRFNYLSAMADQAVSLDRRYVDSYFVIGASGSYSLSKNLRLNARIDNITNEVYAVSRQPFGLRPGAPFVAMFGAQYDF